MGRGDDGHPDPLKQNPCGELGKMAGSQALLPPMKAVHGEPCPGVHLKTPAPVVLVHPEVEKSVPVRPGSEGVPKKGLHSQKSPSPYVWIQASWGGPGPCPRSYESILNSIGYYRKEVGC